MTRALLNLIGSGSINKNKKMKKIIISLIIISGILPAMAQMKKVQPVADAVENLRKAMVDADSVILDKLLADSLSYGHSGGHVEGKAEFISKIVSGKSDFVSIDLTAQTISISKDVAVVRHTLSAKTNDNGKPGEVHLLVLLVWQKQHGDWKLLARQAVKNQ
jgi:ketosteroid isomerase-like protein